MIKTLLGNIVARMDNENIKCDVIKIDNDIRCPNVDGRYKIVISYHNDGFAHRLSCILDCVDVEINLESGEGLEAISFYKNGVKLTIGVECEFTDDNQNCDFGGTYLNNGIEINILPTTRTTKFVFGIAWINNVTDETDVQTWFGADPSYM